MTDPWLTLALMFIGMMLLISQLMSLSSWGWSGTAGVFCLGAVFASYWIAGALAWTAALLLIAGIALLIVESRCSWATESVGQPVWDAFSQAHT